MSSTGRRNNEKSNPLVGIGIFLVVAAYGGMHFMKFYKAVLNKNAFTSRAAIGRYY